MGFDGLCIARHATRALKADGAGHTPLCVAISRSDSSAVEALLAHGAHVHESDLTRAADVLPKRTLAQLAWRVGALAELEQL